jgi:hypothetical protein
MTGDELRACLLSSRAVLDGGSVTVARLHEIQFRAGLLLSTMRGTPGVDLRNKDDEPLQRLALATIGWCDALLACADGHDDAWTVHRWHCARDEWQAACDALA